MRQNKEEQVCYDRTTRTIALGMAEQLSSFIMTLDTEGSDARLPTDFGLRVMGGLGQMPPGVP